MRWEVEFPGYTLLKVELDANEQLFAEPLAMYKGNIKIDTKTMGGIFQTIARSFFGGESVFF